MLQKLLKSAQITFAAFYAGCPSDRTSTGESEKNEPDELVILGGRKRVITSKPSSNSPKSNPTALSSFHQPLTPPT